MAKIINKVGALSTLRKELVKRNIRQFHSIKDIKEFERSYAQQLKDVEVEIRHKLKSRQESISAELDGLIPIIRTKRANAIEEVNERISRTKKRINSLEIQKEESQQRFLIQILVSWHRLKMFLIENGRTRYIQRSFRKERIKQANLTKRFNKLNDNFEDIVNADADKLVRPIKRTKASIDELRPLILGSIGESMVSSKLSSLPDGYIAINDVYIKLSKPIFYPAENDKIFSFQIDHVVVGPGGVFAIETKHWGQDSISNRDLFSPVKQIRRSGHALYIMIKSAVDNGLIRLHGSWGNRAVSVRKIIVFTASSVKEKYEYVKLLDPASLNGYIKWFDEELSAADVKRIVSYLVTRANIDAT